MRRRRRPFALRLFLALAAAALGGQRLGAEAWATAGHERIARVAQAVLKGKAKDKVTKLLKGDMVELANWEEKMTEKYKETDALHWHRQEPEWTCKASGKSADLNHLGNKRGNIICDGKTAENGSLFCALAYFFEMFAHDDLLQEFPPPEVPINTPRSLGALSKVPAEEQQPHHYLRWMMSLVGDLHQPLHWLREYDYGRSIQVQFRGQEMTLLRMWEEFIPLHMTQLPTQEGLMAQYDSRTKRWQDRLPTEQFRDWAQEMGQAICTSVYALMEVNDADGKRTIEQPYKLPEDVFQRWLDAAQEMTLVAGFRVAFVFNEIMEHKKHKAGHGEGRGHHHRKRDPAKNFMINLGIGAIVVPGLLFALRKHANGGGQTMMRFFRQHLKT